MSRNFAVFGKTVPPAEPPSFGPYSGLIRQLFLQPTALALVGSAHPQAEGISLVASELAAELGASGKRVVVVPVSALLRWNPIPLPDESALRPGDAPQVWVWPTPGTYPVELLKPAEPASRTNWLKSLRDRFQAVLLDCPHVEEEPATVEVAALADAAVLLVRAAITSKQQVQHDKSALQLRGVTVAGSILVHER